MNVLIAMFCLGVYTLLAQMLVTRELLIIGLGNELTIGVVFSVWLVLVGAGARLYKQVPSGRASPVDARRAKGERPARMVFVFLWLAAALPAVILAVRGGAGWIRPVGEYPGLFHVFSAAFLSLAPLCVPAGLLFPLACEAYSREGDARGVSGVYAVEALGSFAGGALFSFFLIERFFVMQIVWLGVLASLVGAVCMAGMRRCGVPLSQENNPADCLLPGGRSAATPRERLCGKGGVIAALVVVTIVIIWHVPFLAALEQQSVAWRWTSMGVTRESREGEPAVLFKGGFDTRYQNLAMTESQGLFTLYGDGQVMFSFPDDITSERAVNFVMAQKPDARRILLIGGNPAGELPYLLKYPVREVVYVERDPGIRLLVRGADTDRQERLDHDPRLTRIHDDGPRFVKRCKTVFDVVLIHAPEPVTGGLNRFYTREFYEDVRAILAPGGFMHTSVEASERLERDASRMAGSIYRTLASVFPVVKVTAGSPVHFFVSGCDGELSEDRDALYRLSASVKVERASFQPLYFLNSDEWEPGKVALTKQRLKAAEAPINTVGRPVSCYYTLILWSRYSGSALSQALRWLERMNPWMLAAGLVGVGGAAILIGGRLRRRNPVGVARVAIAQAMAVTGFCGVALELILLYLFQGIYGYVYGRMGVMVGLFMLGTVIGAWQIRRVEQDESRVVGRTVAGCLLLMAGVSVAVSAMSGIALPEGALYGGTLLVGAGVGGQFVAVSRLFVLTGASRSDAAGWVWFADYAGSAVGGLVAGVFLVAVLGIAATCGLMAVLLGVSLLALLLNPPPSP